MPDLNSYVYLNADGQPESINLETGEVTKVHLTATDMLEYAPVERDGKIEFVPLASVPVQYNVALAEAFAYRVMQGDSIQKACKEAGITYPTYCRWRKKYTDFRDMVDEARKDRAEVYFDKIAETVEATEASEDEIALARLKVDAYKYISRVSDSRRFGDKQQIAATVGIARLVVDTGIRREGEPGFEEEEVHGRISQRQEQIVAKEIAEAPASIIRPEGAGLTEAQKDGMVLLEAPDATTKD